MQLYNIIYEDWVNEECYPEYVKIKKLLYFWEVRVWETSGNFIWEFPVLIDYYNKDLKT